MARSRISVLLLLAAFLTPGISLHAATVWTAETGASVSNLLDAANWDNGTPTKENPGTITGVTATNNTNFTPAGSVNDAVDLTIGQDATVNISGNFIPFASLDNSGPAYFKLTVTDNAQLNVTGNFWGGNNNNGPNSQIEGEEYCGIYTFEGTSVTTIDKEWWIGMSGKSHIIVKDNAQVISKAGNSGIGWGGNSGGSLLELQGGLIQAPTFYICQSRTNQTVLHTGGEMRVTNLAFGSWSADPIPNPDVNRRYYLSGSNSTLTVSGNIYNSGLIEIKDGATATVGTYNGKGTLTVKDSATMTVTTYNSVGENESIEAGGTLNVTTFNGQSGNFGINGGTVTIKDLHIGNKADASGAVTLASGELNVTNTFLMGNTANGTGTFTQTGGVMNYTGEQNSSPRILLSTQAGAKSTMNISGGNFNITPAAGTFYMADNDTGTAEVNISGTAALSTQEVRVGQHGLATVNMSAGTWTTNGKAVYIGYMDQVAHGVVNLSGTAELTTGNFRPGYTGVGGADTATGELTMSGNSKLTVNGTFYTFDNVQKANSPGLVKMTLSDNAQVDISGNFWGGINTSTNYTAPREGDYAEYFTFGGESSFACNEWWAAMSAKTYVLIKDSATVTSRGGNSGLGWGIGAKDSVLDQTGGTLTSPSFYLGNETTSTMNLSGGTANLDKVYAGDKATGIGYLNISGTGKLQTTTFTLGNAGSADLTMTGGTADITTLNVSSGAGTGTITLNGESAKLNVGSLDLGRNTGPANLNIQNGTLTVSTTANMASNTGAVTITQSGGKFESTVDVEAARAAGSSITMDLSGGEFITKEFRVATRGTAVMDLSGTALLKTTGAFYPAYNSSANEAVSATLTMSGDSKLEVGGAFIPFRGNHDKGFSGPAYFNMTLDGNADVYVSGNYWGGSNDAGNIATVPEGKNYALEMVYKGDSTFSCNEWWAAMSTKTHILIAENASVTSRSGNSGLAWGTGAKDSVLDQTGGTLTAPSFSIGRDAMATMNLSGGTANLDKLNVGENATGIGVLNVSGNGKLNTTTLYLGNAGNGEMNLSGSAEVKTTGDFLPAYNTSTSAPFSTALNMSGDSKLNIGGKFIPFRGNAVDNVTHPGYFSMTLDGNSDVYVTGNFWGGSDSNSGYATVPEGKDYALEMVYKGDSTFSCNEWWGAMSAKTHILIADNASVISRGGNSGLAWGAGADNSVLEMTGGSLQAPVFKVGNGDGHPATYMQSGGTSTFTTFENYALSTTELSGTAKMQVQTLKNTGTFTLAGGDLYATSIDTTKTLTVTPSGSLQVGTINPTNAETLTITGSDKLVLNGQLVLDVFSQNEIDQVTFASGTPNYGSSATLALNLVNPDEFDPYQINTLQISDLGTDSLNVKILGQDNLAAWMIGSDVVAFASHNAIPEPGTWALLLLGIGALLKVVPSRKKA